jgi:hypothetical protein
MSESVRVSMIAMLGSGRPLHRWSGLVRMGASRVRRRPEGDIGRTRKAFAQSGDDSISSARSSLSPHSRFPSGRVFRLSLCAPEHRPIPTAPVSIHFARGRSCRPRESATDRRASRSHP